MTVLSLTQELQNVEVQKQTNDTNNVFFGEKVGLVAKLFGCWHENMSRPFGHGKIAYRTCLNCGARKPFNTETLRSFGKFYYPPIVKRIEKL